MGGLCASMCHSSFEPLRIPRSLYRISAAIATGIGKKRALVFQLRGRNGTGLFCVAKVGKMM